MNEKNLTDALQKGDEENIAQAVMGLIDILPSCSSPIHREGIDCNIILERKTYLVRNYNVDPKYRREVEQSLELHGALESVTKEKPYRGKADFIVAVKKLG